MTMRELPILFSTPMVKANLEGRKTMTRRTKGLKYINENPNDWEWKNKKRQSVNRLWDSTKEENPNPIETYFILTHKETGLEYKIKSPYGQPGDLLWVRETMGFNKNSETYWPIADGYVKTADYEKIIPSIHVPKIHSRIWLKVINVRVEQLHDITEEDAIKEGVESFFSSLFHETRYFDYLKTDSEWRTAVTSFTSLWVKIYGQKSWELNPWVWVIEYEVLSTTGKPAIVFLDEYAEITNEQRNKLKEAFSL